LKVIDPDKLKSALLSVAGGANVYDEDVMAQLRRNLKGKPDISFNQRELEVLRFVCQGLTNAEIADRLSLRPGTVKNMVSSSMSKTCSISRAQLVKYATENRLME
jgi:DNA-binding NarL/FixJ family response regulator